MQKADKYNTLERQQELLDMMKDIHSFLRSSDIKYSLCGGSLLGAVRHKGFIPWDDDMDIMLDRENYKKMLSNFKKCTGYSISRELWIYRIKKASDCDTNNPPTIDIFVLDNCPDSIVCRRIKIFILQILQGAIKKKIDYSNYSTFYKFCIFATNVLGKFFTDSFKFKIYDSVSQWGNKKSSMYSTCYNDLFKLLKVKYSKNIMLNVSLHPFEDTEFYITDLYDNYLSKQYGDYMKLPDEKDRKPIHI